MSKIYAIQIGTVTYEVRAVDAAEACKKAIRSWQDARAPQPPGGEEATNFTLTVQVRDVPAIRKIEVP